MSKKGYWLAIIFPIASVSSGFGVIIPLYILSLHGNVVDVGLATTAYELVVIPASLIWGEATQKFNKLRFFILLSVIGTLPLIVLLYLLHSVIAAIIIYAVYAFIFTASSPAINILIMNRRKDTVLRSYYGIYGLLSILGNIIGYIPGILLFSDVIAKYLIILLSFNIISILLTFLFIKNYKDKKNIRNKVGHIHRIFPILNSISRLPQILTGQELILKLADIRKRKRTIRIFTMFAAIALVNLGIYLFNTSYIPFLYSFKLSFSDIFLVNVINGIGQAVIYLFFMTGWAKGKLRKYYRISTLIRSSSYLIAIISPIFLAGILYFNMFSYFVAGLGYAMWNVSASVIIYVNISGKLEAHYVGIWSAIIGVSGVLGSILSGFISFYSGYTLTFVLSIIFTVSSIFVFNRAYSNKDSIIDFGNKV